MFYKKPVSNKNFGLKSQLGSDFFRHYKGFAVVSAEKFIGLIAKFADENQSLCNEHMGASEISATWTGLKTVHSNVQHVHDDLANVDAHTEDKLLILGLTYVSCCHASLDRHRTIDGINHTGELNRRPVAHQLY